MMRAGSCHDGKRRRSVMGLRDVSQAPNIAAKPRRFPLKVTLRALLPVEQHAVFTTERRVPVRAPEGAGLIGLE
jgi:hypothetical protein